jgi:hypothetical protein
MIFPQDKQFGAGVKRGWRVAAQEQVRCWDEGREGLVVSSRAVRADVMSFIEDDAVLEVA